MSQFDLDYLYDTMEQTSTRFVCFVGESQRRFDLAVTMTNHFFGKIMVTDLQSGRTAIIGQDDLDEEGYLEHVYRLKEEEANDLNGFLTQLVRPSTFTDM